MNHVEPLSQRHPARMSLTPGQHSLIATAYDRGAFDVRLHQSGLCKKKQIGLVCLHALEKSERH